MRLTGAAFAIRGGVDSEMSPIETSSPTPHFVTVPLVLVILVLVGFTANCPSARAAEIAVLEPVVVTATREPLPENATRTRAASSDCPPIKFP